MTFIRKNDYRQLFDVDEFKNIEQYDYIEFGCVIQINEKYYEVVEINYKRRTLRGIEVSRCLEN